MQQDPAFAVFVELQKPREVDNENFPEPYIVPRFDVRLDAFTDSEGERDYRVFVREGKEAYNLEQDDWRFVLDQAQEHGLKVSVENNGIELS